MKKTFRKICLTAFAILTSTNAFAWSWESGGQGTLNGSTWYALHNTSESSFSTFSSKEYTLNAPPATVSYEAKRGDILWVSGGDLRLGVYTTSYQQVYSATPPKNNYQSYGPINVNIEGTKIKLYTEVGATGYKYFKNIFATQATYLSVTENSEITIPTTIVGETATATFKVKYSNGTYNKDLTITSSDTQITTNVTKIDDGKFGIQTITVTYKPTKAGNMTATISLNNGNAASVKINASARPATPAATAATNIAAKSFTANWNASAGAEKYRLTVYNGSTSVFTTETTATTFDVTGLDCSTAYTYSVVAIGGGYESATASNSISVTTQTPLISSDKTAVDFSVVFGNSAEASVNLTSQYLVDAINIALQGGEPYSVSPVTINESGALTINFAPNTIGRFADIIIATSECAAELNIAISGVAIPVAPIATEATNIRCETFTANWEAVENASYTLYLNGEEKYSGTENSYEFTGLEPNTAYNYYVTVTINDVTSEISNTIYLSTLPVPVININGDETVKSAINAQANITLTVSSENTVEDIAAIITDESGFFSIDKNTITESGNIILTFAPTAVGEYTATITISSDLAEEKTISVTGTAIPATPVATAATNIACKTFTANWETVENATYTLYLNGEEKYNGTESSYDFTELQANTEYSYYVIATIDGFVSEQSNTITLNTLPTPTINIEGETEINCTYNLSKEIVLTVSSENAVEEIAIALTDENGFFSIDKNAITESGNITLTFAPTTVGVYKATVTISSKYAEDQKIEITGTATPVAPVATEATNIRCETFTANWESVADATAYTLYVNGEEKYTGTETYFDLSGLTANTQYAYYVTANVGEYVTEPSNTIEVNTLKTPVINIEGGTEIVTILNETATLTFNVSSENAIEDIAIALTDESGYFSIDKNAITESGDITLTFAPATVGKFTATLKLTTDMAEEKTVSIDATANPQTPVATEATNVRCETFTANWEAMEGATFTLYVNNKEKYIGTENSFELTGLTANTEYTYYVTATINELTSEVSNTINVNTLKTPVISIEGETEIVTIVNETATLTFNVSSENAIENIAIALDSESGYFSIDKNAITESGDITLTFAPATVGKYTATLKLTTDMAEEKTVSINATANPQTPVATEATNISGVSFTANWEAIENASSYILTILSNNYENVITVDGNETSHNVTNLISSTVYTYTVKVVVNELTSDYSNTITVTTTGGAAISYKEFNTSFIATRGSNDRKTVEVTAAELTENIQATVSGSDFFSIENNTLTAEGGTFDIVFAPTAVGTYSSEITLKSGETTITINISGTANTEAPVATEATDLQPTSFVANWEAVAGASYTLYVNDEVKYEGNETSALVEGLIPNVQYNYYVTATINSFVSEKSNTISVNSLETPVISISGENNLNAVNNEQESVTLNIVGENIVSKIDVTLADESGFFSIDKTELQESGELTLTFAPNIIGKYEGSIIISSEFAESKTFKFTGICKPAAPTATEASDIRGTTFVANWNGIETDNATYYVEVKKDDVIAYGEYTKDTNIKVNGLEAETAYTYTVNAIINDIWSAPSNEISVSTSKPVIAYTDFEKSFNLQINDWENKTVNLTPSALDHHIDVTIEGSEYFGLNDVITSKDGGSFNITFLPRATGVFNAQVTLVSEGAEDVVINITGTATPRKTSAFGVNDVTNSSCIAYWSASEGATNYILKVNGNEVYRGNETSFEVTNLAVNTNYTLELIAIDDNNLESEPATATVTTVNAPAIADITAIPAFNTIVNKTQNQTVTVAGENLLGAIYVTIEGDEAFIISNGQINANEELVIGLTSDTPGNYEATLTFNSRNAETKTLNVSGTVRPKTASSKAATEVSSNSFRTNWVKSSANATYTVIVKNGNNIVATKEVEAGNTSVVIDGLNAATAYTYTVIATENGIDADASEVISVTTDEEAATSITFNASVSAEKTTATVKWIVISDTDVTPTSVKVTCNGNTQTLSGNATSCTITGLNKSSGYSATVTALIDGKEYTKTVSFATKGDYYGSQLPNPDFELWESSTSENAEPIGWNGFKTATGSYANMGASQMNKSTSVKRPGTKGSASVVINTRKAFLKIMANGNLTTGRINMGSMTADDFSGNYNYTDRSNNGFNAPFTMTPDSLTFWVKFESGTSGDGDGTVNAVLHGNIDMRDPIISSNSGTYSPYVVATASGKISESNSNWIRKTVPFSKGTSTDPRYMLITFNTNENAGKGDTNDKLYVDDILMIYKPTLTVNNLNNTQYQAGDAITLNFSITGTMSPYNLNAAANVAYLELSDANGSFSSPIVLDQITTDFGGTFMGKLPFNIADGNYKIRVRTTNYPMTSGTQNITVSTPVVELGDIEATEASDITSSSFVANWNAAENAEGYYLTVKDGEGEIVGDYDKKDMGNKLYEEVVIDTKGTASMYSYIVTAYRGSEEKKSEWINVTLSSTTGIDDADAEQFVLIVYPNPAIDVIHITNAEKVAEALVYDINGALRIAQNNGNDINVSTMAQGTYILKVKTTNGKMYHTIFIKEK